MSAIVEWLKQAMAEQNVSQAELARRMGTERILINKIIHGRRRVTADELIKISRALNVVPPLTLINAPPQHRYITVVGEVAAGAWKEVSYAADFDTYEVPIILDPKWPEDAVYGLEVRGESINRQARDGDIVSVLRIEHAPRSFASGDWVVVERTRGEMRETTVKQVRHNGRGWELWPDSTDPRYQEPIIMATDDTDSIRVVGFVLNFVRQGTQF
ncbi:MAG TPA: LexA family transcriptional regulator [Herpetosiphonaceae bacterium]|nr:LexA family transcriptional regulator [Herpetosiphonaceae bacterium]